MTEHQDYRSERGINASNVLVVGKSPINRVVVSKIVERSGLTALSHPPDLACAALIDARPGMIILDGGPDGKDCDLLMSEIAAQRRLHGKPVPAVIMLSMRIGTPETLAFGACVDAVVAKPILPETLQPVVDRLVTGLRS